MRQATRHRKCLAAWQTRGCLTRRDTPSKGMPLLEQGQRLIRERWANDESVLSAILEEAKESHA